MKLIVAVDNNYGIGYKNNLLVKNDIDMKYFKEKTLNNIIIMGRKTLESFPNQKALPNRINIVLTKDKNYKKENIIIYNSVEKLLELNSNILDNCYIIGGESIYNQLIDYCDELLITKMKNEFICDTYFPYDKLKNFTLVEESKKINYNDIEFKFLKYKRE